MNGGAGRRKVTYEAELDPDFAAQVASIPGGEALYTCIQCGTCSGMCPLSAHMDYTPRRIVAMIRAGFRGEVLRSTTTWLCASCYACTVECPKQIRITEIMYAVKRLAIREGLIPKRFPTTVLAREFFGAVERYGRNSEGPLLVRLYARTNPFAMLKQIALGWGLLRRGRMSMKRERIRRTDELTAVLKAVEKERMIKEKNKVAAAGGQEA